MTWDCIYAAYFSFAVPSDSEDPETASCFHNKAIKYCNDNWEQNSPSRLFKNISVIGASIRCSESEHETLATHLGALFKDKKMLTLLLLVAFGTKVDILKNCNNSWYTLISCVFISHIHTLQSGMLPQDTFFFPTFFLNTSSNFVFVVSSPELLSWLESSFKPNIRSSAIPHCSPFWALYLNSHFVEAVIRWNDSFRFCWVSIRSVTWMKIQTDQRSKDSMTWTWNSTISFN